MQQPARYEAPPPPQKGLIRGDVAQPMYVLTRPDIRNAERVLKETVFRTSSGDVIGRPGERDIAVTQGDETYPIPRRVFYGTYEVINEHGAQMIARRLVHVRIAREVTSADAEFNYGGASGIVSVDRGGWLYQSDDDDEGMVSRDRKRVGHVEVGPIKEVDNAPWPTRFRLANAFLTFLPPVLTALALLSLEASHSPSTEWFARTGPAIETALLLLGLGVAVWIRSQRWALKAAVSAGMKVSQQFQVAAEILGEGASQRFPQMTLWRAAQMPPRPDPATLYSAQNVERFTQLRKHLGETQDEINQGIERNDWIERAGEGAELLAVTMAVGFNLYLLFWSESTVIELASLWLPSLIGAFHALRSHRRTAERIPLLTDFAKQLKYVKTRLQALHDWRPDESPEMSAERESVLRFTCKIIGQYCQAELQQAMNQHPDLPF